MANDPGKIPLSDKSTGEWLSKFPGWYERADGIYCYEIDDCLWGIEVDIHSGVTQECAEYRRDMPNVQTRGDLVELVRLMRDAGMPEMEVTNV